jgi:hypothetical protein
MHVLGDRLVAPGAELADCGRNHVEAAPPAKSRFAPNARRCLSLDSGSQPGPTRSRGAGATTVASPPGRIWYE